MGLWWVATAVRLVTTDGVGWMAMVGEAWFGQMVILNGSLIDLIGLAGISFIGLIVSLVMLVFLGRAFFYGWKYLGKPAASLFSVIFPDSIFLQFAMAMVVFTVVIAGLGAAPFLLGSETETTENSAAELAEQLAQKGLTSDVRPLNTDGNTRVLGGGSCQGDSVSGPDTDNDGLPDRWERAGKTDDGARLPGADPDQKDLYVQVNYGTNAERLSETERAQLRAIWEQMPVENPDGTTGIDIHIIDSGEHAGSLGEEAVFDSSQTYSRYYTVRRLGPRQCVYHQVVYGRVDMDAVGYAAAPGYVSIVEGAGLPSESFEENRYTLKVGVTTHELLHNVVGRVDGRTHTSSGWLAPSVSSQDEQLSRPTAQEINQSGIFGPAAPSSFR